MEISEEKEAGQEGEEGGRQVKIKRGEIIRLRGCKDRMWGKIVRIVGPDVRVTRHEIKDTVIIPKRCIVRRHGKLRERAGRRTQ